jgi:antiviral helicase SKI2
MADSLSSSLSQLRLKADHFDTAAFDAQIAGEEAGSTESFKPRKRVRRSLDDLKLELEDEFLTPSPRFSPDWLNRLQR